MLAHGHNWTQRIAALPNLPRPCALATPLSSIILCRVSLLCPWLQGVQLDEAYSLSALQLALEEMPRAWAEQARRDPRTMLMKVSGKMPGRERCRA